jgi:putative flippase GtrA
MGFMRIKRLEFTQLAKYLSLGGLGASVDSMVFVILNQVGVRPVIANTISTLFGIGVSYGLNSKYTFNQNQYSRLSATKFLVVGLVGLVFSNITLWLLIEIFDMKPFLAKVVTLPLVALIQFTLNKMWTFNDPLIQKD